MSSLLRRLLDRSTQKVNRVAAGTPLPAGLEPGERRGPTARERTLMRRRLRALRRRREALAREDGSRTQELEAVDAEARALVEALDERKTLDELLASGACSRCPACGELGASHENYCTNCGAQQRPNPQVATPAPAHPRAPVVTGASSAQSRTPPAH
jgi:ribosomal protein L32